MNPSFPAVIRAARRSVEIDDFRVFIVKLPREPEQLLSRQNDATDCLSICTVVLTLERNHCLVVFRFHLGKDKYLVYLVINLVTNHLVTNPLVTNALVTNYLVTFLLVTFLLVTCPLVTNHLATNHLVKSSSHISSSHNFMQ